jgi:hypothetical protein
MEKMERPTESERVSERYLREREKEECGNLSAFLDEIIGRPKSDVMKRK